MMEPEKFIGQADEPTPLVSIIIPMRNERSFIERFMESLSKQDYPADRTEVIIADGMSTDGSREIVDAFAARCPRVTVIDNPGRIVPTGLNAAIRRAKGRYILRMDAHSEYGDDYVSKCVYFLQRTGAENVGGPVITRPGADTPMARTIAAITANRYVVGGSRFRVSMEPQYSDTCVFGAWPREVFSILGGFNEALARNQDNEFNSRLVHHGGKIFQTPQIRVIYYNQSTLAGLLRQAYRTGCWNVLTLIANPWSFKFRYFAPFGLVCWLLAFGLASIVNGLFLVPLMCALVPYAVLLVAVSMQVWRNEGLEVAIRVPSAVASYHLAYGVGTCMGVIKFLVLGRETRRRARAQSRILDRDAAAQLGRLAVPEEVAIRIQ